MTGLDEIRKLMAVGKRPPMMELLDIDLIEADHGRVVFAATPTQQSYNIMGIVHGGYAATLLDSACGVAVSAAAEKPVTCVTLELKVAYHAALTDQVGTVRAIGQIVSMGRRVAYTEAKLVDANDKLFASATSTLLITERR
ncbi:PaaI family thioesterase [Sphingomonas sp.]|uniref:PaaI family thioesterase n=1 Tax=Sphingomonas sp. TaxID=28214 RepID=UPI000DB813CA|nr:PaaI family thioesterase [Sphingomonas sp.]PZU06846.1 MAG: thioesterase [Sphingomonas sp.]